MPSADDFLDGPDAPKSKSADDFLDGGDGTDHTGIVSKALAATVKTPFPLPPRAGVTNAGASPFGGPGAPVDDPWKPEEQQMAKDGTDITSGAPYGLRNRLSLMVDPKDSDVRDVVNQSFGKDVGVARNKYGELEYTSPDTGRRTLLSSRGKNLPNLAPTVGGAMDTVGQAGGAIAAGYPTAMATGNPLLVAGASSFGAGIGQAVSDGGKTIINAALGAGNKSNPDDQITAIGKDAVKAGAYNMAGEMVGMVPGAARWAGRGFLDLAFSKAVDLRAVSADAAKSLDAYNTLIGSQAGVKPSIAELVPNDAKTRIINEKAYKSSEDLTAEEEKRINSNLDTLSYNYQNFADAFKPSPTYQTGSSGYNIQQAMDAKKAVALSQQQLSDSVQKADAAQQVAGLPALTETERNQMMTEMLNRTEAAGKAKKDQDYGDLRVSLGVPQEFAYDRTSNQWMASRKPEDVVEMSPEAQTKLTNMWQKGMDLENTPLKSGDKYFSAIPEDFYVNVNNPKQGLTFNQKEATSVTQNNVDRLPDGLSGMGIAPKTWSMTTNTPAVPSKYDILDLIDNVQDLHSGTRSAMAAARGRIPADEQASAHVADILSDEIAGHLNAKGDPRVLDQWEKAKQSNQQYEEDFGRGIINSVMKRTGGFQDPVYDSATSKLLMDAGKGQDQTGVAKLAKILKGSPDETERVRGMIWSIYKDHYLPASGIPDQASFQAYKDQMEGPMKSFFTPAENAKMDSFSAMTDSLAASAKSLKTFNQAWKRSPEYGGIPTTSQGLSNAVFKTSTSPQVLDKMVTMVGGMRPELMQEWKADTAREFARRTSDASGMPVDSLVSKYVNQYGDRLSKIMGPEYVANLKTYQRTAQMVQGGSGIKLDPDRPASVLTQIIRAKFAPPMSAEGRWYTALLNWRKQAAGRVVYNALKSPENLSKFIQLKQSQALSPMAGGVLGDLHGQALGNSILGKQTPQQDPNDVSSPQ